MFCTLMKLNFSIRYRVFYIFNRTKSKNAFYAPSKLHKNLKRTYCTNKKINHLVSSGLENLFTYQTIKNSVRFPNRETNTLLNELLDPLKNNKELIEQDKLTIANKLKLCSDEELVKLLMNIENVEKTEAIKQGFKLIDLEGSLRISKAKPSVVLAGAIQTYILQMHFRSEWIWSCLKRFCRRLDKISSSEVLQVMFLINLTRKIPEQYSGFDVQNYLVQHIDNYSLDELSVISCAFFKSETKMNNAVIMSKIIRKLLNEAETCGNVSIGLLSKIIKYSLPIQLSEELLTLQGKLVKEVPRMTLRSLTHIALAGTNVLVCHEPLIRAIIDRVRNILPELRIKDMERLLFVISLFNINDTDFTERIINELVNREEEITKFPKSFVSLVNYLIILNFYQEPFINRVLSDKFFEDTYINFKKIGGELIFIDKSVDIERPDYRGNRLSTKIVTKSAKIMTFTKNSILTGTQKFSYELEDTLTQLYGKENQAFVGILPHYHFPDFAVRFNSNFVPKNIPEEFRIHRWGEIKKAPDDDNIWISVIVGGWNTIVRNTEEPLGSTLTKMRQLSALGYHPVLIPFFSYRTSTDKRNYVKNKIDEILKNVAIKRSVKTN